MRNLYLGNIAKGNIQGPGLEYASISKPWLASEKCIVDLPDANMSAYDYIYVINKDHLGEVAFEYDPIPGYESTKITYRDFFEEIDKLATAYQNNLDIKEREIITVCLPSFIENIVNFYALNKIGAISNQIHPIASEDEFEFYLNEAESRYLVTYENVYSNFKNKVEKLKNVIIVSPIDKIALDTKIKIGFNTLKQHQSKKQKASIDLKNGKYIKYKKLVSKGKNSKLKPAEVRGKDVAVLTHTSGTTGKSKAVETSNYAFNKMVEQIACETSNLKRGDKELLVLPPYPMYVLCNHIHMCLARGITIIVIPQVDLKDISSYFKKHKPNCMQAIPLYVEAMLNDKRFDGEDLSYLKFVVSGGGAISLNTEKEFNEFCKSHNSEIVLTSGYGETEMGSCATCTFGEKGMEGKVGRPLCENNIKIIDDEGNELPYNHVGEICLAGPSRMEGYYKNEEATKKVFDYSKDGYIYVKTGDLGSIDEKGILTVVGRIKRTSLIFDSETNTVSKASHDYVESIIKQNPNVLGCVVISVDDAKQNKALKAYITLRNNDYEKTLDELHKLCMSKFRKLVEPAEFIIINEIPQTKALKDDYRYIERYENDELKSNERKVKILYRKKVE